jgi:hypothetical protein
MPEPPYANPLPTRYACLPSVPIVTIKRVPTGSSVLHRIKHSQNQTLGRPGRANDFFILFYEMLGYIKLTAEVIPNSMGLSQMMTGPKGHVAPRHWIIITFEPTNIMGTLQTHLKSQLDER